MRDALHPAKSIMIMTHVHASVAYTETKIHTIENMRHVHL